MRISNSYDLLRFIHSAHDQCDSVSACIIRTKACFIQSCSEPLIDSFASNLSKKGTPFGKCRQSTLLLCSVCLPFFVVGQCSAMFRSSRPHHQVQIRLIWKSLIAQSNNIEQPYMVNGQNERITRMCVNVLCSQHSGVLYGDQAIKPKWLSDVMSRALQDSRIDEIDIVWRLNGTWWCKLISANNQVVTETCLGCICEAISGCNRNTSCTGDVCGLFRLTWAYWADSGKPTVGGEAPTSETGNSIDCGDRRFSEKRSRSSC